MKKCPFCAEEIQDEAIVCKHCGRELAPHEVARISKTLTGAEEISEEPKPAVQKELTKQDLADPIEVSKPQRPTWMIALRTGVLLASIYAIYLLTQITQRGVNPDRITLDLIIGGLTWFGIGTLLGALFTGLRRRDNWFLLAVLILILAGVFYSYYASNLL